MDYEEMDEDGGDMSDREIDLEDVRAQVAQLTAGHTVLELNGESGAVPELPEGAGGYSAVVAEFCWSRLKREEQDGFLAKLRKAAGKDALLVLLDDVYGCAGHYLRGRGRAGWHAGRTSQDLSDRQRAAQAPGECGERDQDCALGVFLGADLPPEMT
jgi:hypothetical protein